MELVKLFYIYGIKNKRPVFRNIYNVIKFLNDAGSGSIFETLKLGKPLIVVVNEDLMDNHQCELAEALEERKHLYCARPHTLHQALTKMELESLVRYTPGDGTPVARIIDRFLGFPDD